MVVDGKRVRAGNLDLPSEGSIRPSKSFVGVIGTMPSVGEFLA